MFSVISENTKKIKIVKKIDIILIVMISSSACVKLKARGPKVAPHVIL